MKREIFKTGDGSHSLRIPEWDEQYHSKHGAIREARHVYLKNGLAFFLQNHDKKQRLSVLEIGFGTGLNALLTALFAESYRCPMHYTALEAFPIEEEQRKRLNYPQCLNEASAATVYEALHQAPWQKITRICHQFQLEKLNRRFEEFNRTDQYDVVFYDAFGPRVQPELWTAAIFANYYKAMHPQGVLVTYSAKGSVRRHLKAVGFKVEKIPGPPGKREMLRAIKPLGPPGETLASSSR